MVRSPFFFIISFLVFHLLRATHTAQRPKTKNHNIIILSSLLCFLGWMKCGGGDLCFLTTRDGCVLIDKMCPDFINSYLNSN